MTQHNTGLVWVLDRERRSYALERDGVWTMATVWPWRDGGWRWELTYASALGNAATPREAKRAAAAAILEQAMEDIRALARRA